MGGTSAKMHDVIATRSYEVSDPVSVNDLATSHATFSDRGGPSSLRNIDDSNDFLRTPADENTLHNLVDLSDSPRNSVESDIESILGYPNIDLAALTVFDRPPRTTDNSVPIPSSSNVTIQNSSKVKNKNNKGKMKSIALFSDEEENLKDIPIDMAEICTKVPRTLRAGNPD